MINLLTIGSANKKGGQMMNKSYASSEIGGEESRYGANDPEYSKDFNSAYSKVKIAKVHQSSWSKNSTRNKKMFI